MVLIFGVEYRSCSIERKKIIPSLEQKIMKQDK